ncbi:MAG: hypothetical protein KKF50_02300 [Nanoarchaeota archaeon]|nr:hypothetical protein [Nanoarchaeota archaeon]
MEHEYQCPKNHGCNWNDLLICDKNVLKTNNGYRALFEGGMFFGECPYSKLVDRMELSEKKDFSFKIEKVLERG